MGRTLAVSLLFAVPTVVPVACGDDDNDAASNAGASDEAELEDVVVMDGTRVDVVALDNSFNHQNVQVDAGTTVVWENKGRQDHDLVPVDGDGWGVGQEEFAPGDTYERTFEEPGTYRYYCTLHGDAEAGMIGAVVVEELSPASADDQADSQDNDS